MAFKPGACQHGRPLMSLVLREKGPVCSMRYFSRPACLIFLHTHRSWARQTADVLGEFRL
jgi:hypothetical protein